mgnify:FL=1
MKNKYFGRCQSCGREYKISKGSFLKMCWRCAMTAADRVRAKEMQGGSQYDWRKMITAIKNKYHLGKESTVAFALKLSPSLLSKIKKYQRSMPEESLKIIKEKYSNCIFFKIKENISEK